MYPNPNYVDGLQAVVDLSVYCYNNGKTYMTYNGDPSPLAVQKDIRNSDGQLIGSTTYIDGRKGNLAMQYNLASDEADAAAALLLPTYIVSFRSRFYVLGEVKASIVKNSEIKLAAPITQLMNPFVPILLSTLGQQLKENKTANSSYTVNCAASNTRTGSTLTYSIETFATPGSAAPAGFTINSSTGVLTVNAAAATYDVRVVVKDDVGDGNPIYGWGRYTPTLA